MGEFDLIASIRARAAAHRRDDVVLGIGDDAALLQVPAGHCLVTAMDTLNSGVHFPARTAPADIGWKALAVNLSDLAAMAATPAWCTLSLSLPDGDRAWVDGFLDGFLPLAAAHGVALVGGDTTRGPLSICVAAHGWVDPARALRRDGARPGDDVWVTGTLGDAAAALAQWTAGAAMTPALAARLDRPTPRVDTGRALGGVAHAGVDLSDGLLADLGHVLRASGVGAELWLAALPTSEALRQSVAEASRHALQACGGDDYELCISAPASARAALAAIAAATATPITRIGAIVAGSGLQVRDATGAAWSPGPHHGHDHFAEHD